MKISEWLGKNEAGAVLADSNSGVVRLWTAPVKNPATRRAVQRFFPCAEFKEGFTRLGGWSKLTEAISQLAEAKMTTTSKVVAALHLVERRDGVGMATIPDRCLA